MIDNEVQGHCSRLIKSLGLSALLDADLPDGLRRQLVIAFRGTPGISFPIRDAATRSSEDMCAICYFFISFMRVWLHSLPCGRGTTSTTARDC